MKCPLCNAPMRKIAIKRIEGYVHRPSECALYRVMAWETADLEYFRTAIAAAYQRGQEAMRERAAKCVEIAPGATRELVSRDILALQPESEQP